MRPRLATVSITLDTYSHADPAMQEEAAALIADWCSRARRTSPPAAETATPTLLKRVHCRYRLSVAKGLA